MMQEGVFWGGAGAWTKYREGALLWNQRVEHIIAARIGQRPKRGAAPYCEAIGAGTNDEIR